MVKIEILQEDEWIDVSEMVIPCQPIGCDARIHLKGCVYAIVDNPERCMETESGNSE